MEPASAAMSRSSGEVGTDRPAPTAEPGAGGAPVATDGGGN